jgi:hypothetical protein
MGFGRAQQSVTTIVTRSINRDHLGVFGKGVGHLGIAGGDLCVNMITSNKSPPSIAFIWATRSGRVVATAKSARGI